MGIPSSRGFGSISLLTVPGVTASRFGFFGLGFRALGLEAQGLGFGLMVYGFRG